jgi:hypothetical protein
MAEIKVRVLDDSNQKSKAQVEEELLQKHEEKFVDSENTETTEAVAETPEVVEEAKSSFSDEDVLSHIKERYNKEIKSLDELFEEREATPELPEDVAAYFKYKKETGRSIEDFVNLNKDLTKEDPDKVLAKYYKSQDEYLDDEDIEDMISEFTYDEDLDEEKDIKKKRLAKKRALSEAFKYFEGEKEKYKMPLESSSASLSSETEQELKEYKTMLQNAKEQEEQQRISTERFVKQTEELFNDDFKGFDFKLEDSTYTYTPGTPKELASTQSDFMNFLRKFLDKDGLMTDFNGYHRALAIANNPDKFAKFFYEQGKANATTDIAKKSKNISLDSQKIPQVNSKGGLQVRAVSPSSDGNRLKIRKMK